MMDHVKNSGFLGVVSLRETRLATLLFLAILFFLQSPVNAAAGESPFSDGCYIGAYLGCGVEDSSCPSIEAFNDMTGKRHSIFIRYVDITYAGTQADWDWVTEVKRNGAYPLFMYDPYGGLDALDFEKVEEFAKKCGDFDWPIFVVFGHEMNGMWYPWGQQPELYKEKFKQVAEIFHQCASKARMVWCPNQNWGYPWGGADHGDGYTEYYPQGAGLYGEYVDWVGLVFYEVDWDETDDIPPDFFIVNITNGQDDIDFHNVFAAGKNKPMIICETAAFDSHDDTLCSTPPCNNCPVFSEKQKAFKNIWIDQVYDVGTLKNSFPMLQAICWFHVLKNETIYTRDCGFAVEADYRIPDDHYNVKISDDYFISAHYKGDFDEDGDVDGTDLAELAANPGLLDLSSFAAEFGRTDCL